MGTLKPRETETKSKVTHIKVVCISDPGPMLSKVYWSLYTYHTDT